MKKNLVISFATATSIAALFAASSAFGAQNVASPTQKGSLLVFPLISVDTATSGQYGAQDTFVEISNDQVSPVTVECNYKNEARATVDFSFVLTAKQTVSWDVGTASGDQVTPPPFPTSGSGVDANRGELVCFATDNAVANQIAWNELSGTATVMNFSAPSATEPKQSYKYNAWAFAARGPNGIIGTCTQTTNCEGDVQGTAGDLVLSGLNATGAYDACPAYDVANFMPNGASLGKIKTINNDLVVASCDIDVTEAPNGSSRKLAFTVWNSDEEAYTGAYACVGDINTVQLGGTASPPGEPKLVNGGNFLLNTPDGRFMAQGLDYPGLCGSSTESKVGLLGILESSAAIAGDSGSDELDGIPLTGAGVAALAGQVLWNPSSGVQQKPRSGWRN